MYKKGQIGFGIPDVISILMFVAIAALVFGLLSFADSAKKQEIIDGLEDTSLDESLIVYLKMPTGDFSNVADEIVKSNNKGNFGDLNEFTIKNLNTGSDWVIFVLDREDNKLNEVQNFEFDYEGFFYSSLDTKNKAEQFIPDRKGKVLKVVMYKFEEGELW